MNRFKKELRRRGYKLECDYTTLPYKTIEAVQARAESVSYDIFSNTCGWICTRFDRDFSEIPDDFNQRHGWTIPEFDNPRFDY